QETIEKVKLISFRESASIFLVFPRLGERVFKGRVVTKMGRNKKRILLLALLEREHWFIYGGADQTTNPIDCRLVVALCRVSTDTHSYEPIAGFSHEGSRCGRWPQVGLGRWLQSIVAEAKQAYSPRETIVGNEARAARFGINWQFHPKETSEVPTYDPI